jgi:enoyl-CoA hydratase
MTQILPRLIGLNRARQMSLTGEFLTARRAEAWGLINEVVADDALLTRSHDLAAQIAETDRSTMTRIRDLIGRSAETGLSDGLAEEAAMFRHHIGGVTGDAVDERRKAVTERGRRVGKT